MRTLTILILLLSVLGVSATELPRDFPAMHIVLLQANHDAAELDRLEAKALDENNQALLNLLHLHRAAWKVQAYKDNSRLQHRTLQAFTDSARRRGEERPETLGWCFLSMHFWGEKAHDQAFLYGLRAYQRYRHYSESAFPYKSEALYQLAGHFYYYRDFRTAGALLREALNLEGRFGPGPVILRNTLGLCERSLGRYDSAIFYFRQALPLITGQRKVWTGILNGNIGIALFHQGHYEEAIPYLETDIEHSLNQNAALDNAANSLSVLAEIRLRQGLPTQAAPLLQKALEIVERHNYHHHRKLTAPLYQRLAQLAEIGQRPREAAFYWKKALHALDSLNTETSALVSKGAELKVAAEAYNAETRLLSQDLRLHVWQRNGLMAAIALVAIIALLIIYQLRLRHRFRQEQLQGEQRKAEQELADAERRLRAFTRSLHEKNELLERLRGERTTTSGTGSDSDDPALLTELRGLTILTEAEWEHFQELFEKVHKGFLSRLHQQLPGLSPADIRYIVLSRLRFSNKEIAAVLGIGAASVRVTRSRLRKKLGLGEEEALDAMIAAI